MTSSSSSAPHPLTTTDPSLTCAQIFTNTLPSVRQFHKQLHTALDEKNARLRTLVGGSYRQLLGTAEMIVTMRDEMQDVENRLGLAAQRCGRGEVGKRVAGLGKLGAWGEGDGPSEKMLGWIARMKVLEGCIMVVGRVLRGKESLSGSEEAQKGAQRRLVVTAKVLVLSRLLIKSLGDEVKDEDISAGVEGAEKLVEDMRKKIGSQRRRLLRSIERVLERLDGERDDLTEALCAYSLTTSSGAKDVLRHFLHVRGEAMAMAFESEDESEDGQRDTKKEAVLKALGLYTRTLLDVQALVPRHLADALLSLKGRPLLQDEIVRSLEGLRLDVCDRWFGEEFKFFTPYIRHDDLDGPQAVSTLKGWAKKASEVLLQGFEKTLEAITDFKSVIDLRTKLFEMWNKEGGKAKGFDSSVMLDGLRKVINARLVALLEARVGKLHILGTEIEATLGTIGNTNSPKQGIWDDDVIHMELNQGATMFKQAIVSRVYGRNDSVSRVIKSYETWRHLVDEMVSTFDELRKQRWDDDLDSLEDDLSLENRNTLLSKDDPEMLEDLLNTNMKKSFEDLHKKLVALLKTHEGSEDSGASTFFMLRILRDLRSDIPSRPDLSSFGLPLIPQLHETLTRTVAIEPVSVLSNALENRKRISGRALWEGSPELPIYPSPAIFKFFHGMTSSMADAGADLWSPTALQALKRHICEQLGKELGRLVKEMKVIEAHAVNGKPADAPDAVEKPEPEQPPVENGAGIEDGHTENGATAVETPTPNNEELLLQSLLDIYVLKCCFVPASSPELGADLVSLENLIKSRIDLTSSSNDRLLKTAQEHWKRTSLLFGLLA